MRRLVLADAADLAGLRAARSSLACSVCGHRADLVEEERAAVRVLDQARPRRCRAGEGAARVAEQLVLEQRFGERRAVEGDERLRARGLLAAWIARATSSLPVPVSPVMSTVPGAARGPGDQVLDALHRWLLPMSASSEPGGSTWRCSRSTWRAS